MRILFIGLMMLMVWATTVPPAAAETHLVPCQESAAFQERMQNAPQGYFFDQPYESYSANLMCGDEGLPHLQLRFDRAIDVIIPFGIFFYFAGFVGWSGRAYLIGSKQKSKPEQLEIFIDLALAISSLIQGLLWPLLAVKELISGELSVKDSDLSVSPR